MLAIKFKRIGKKHQASFRIVVGERRSKVLGKFIDDLGWYSPRTDSHEIDTKKAEHWLSVGAQPTDSVRNLLIKSGVVRGKKIPLHLKPKKAGEAPSTGSGQIVAASPVPAAVVAVSEAPVAAETAPAAEVTMGAAPEPANAAEVPPEAPAVAGTPVAEEAPKEEKD